MQEPQNPSLSMDAGPRSVPADPSPVGATSSQAQAPVLPTVGFDFYGLAVRVDSDSAEVVRRVGDDFLYFRRALGSTDEVALTIDMRKQPPYYGRLPTLEASIYTPRNICYTQGDITYIDYFGRALAVYDRFRRALAT